MNEVSTITPISIGANAELQHVEKQSVYSSPGSIPRGILGERAKQGINRIIFFFGQDSKKHTKM